MRYFAFFAVMVAVMATAVSSLAGGGGTASAAGDITVTATASGPMDPQNEVANGPCSIPNGDFEIYTTGVGPVFQCGDGLDESTRWTFDFTTDASYSAFFACLNIGGTLSNATLTLNLVSRGTSTDGVGMFGKNGGTSIRSTTMNGQIAAGPLGQTSYSHNWASDPAVTGPIPPAEGAAAVKANFLNPGPVNPPGTAAGTGQIAMNYQDDAVIYGASLVLTTNCDAVGGIVDLVSSTDSARDYTLLAAAAVVAGAILAGATGWYARRRLL